MKDNPDWDLIYMHTHLIDWFYHGFLDKMDSDDPAVSVKHRFRPRAPQSTRSRTSSSASMMDLLPEDALTCLISDHGATPIGPILNTADALKQAGLTAYEAREGEGNFFDESEGFNYELIPEKSKAVPQRYMFVYVNLKSKYPGGIVEDEDYEKVRNEIIDALLRLQAPRHR